MPDPRPRAPWATIAALVLGALPAVIIAIRELAPRPYVYWLTLVWVMLWVAGFGACLVMWSLDRGTARIAAEAETAARVAVELAAANPSVRCDTCGERVVEWFTQVLSLGLGQTQVLCHHCADALPYPEPNESEDHYMERQAAIRVAAFMAKLSV